MKLRQTVCSTELSLFRGQGSGGRADYQLVQNLLAASVYALNSQTATMCVHCRGRASAAARRRELCAIGF